MRSRNFRLAAMVGGAVVFTAALIYLTPLKHLNVIEPAIKDIAPREFYAEFRNDPARFVFVDVRPAEVYNRGHAEGSINIPLHQLYTERRYLPKSGREIVLICSGGSASGVAYGYLEHYGFLNLRRIEGGIEAWEEAGLPTASR